MTKNKKNDSDVTLAVINTKLEYIQNDLDEIKKRHKDFSKCIALNKDDITALKTKMRDGNIVLGALSILIGAIASFLGVRR